MPAVGFISRPIQYLDKSAPREFEDPHRIRPIPSNDSHTWQWRYTDGSYDEPANLLEIVADPTGSWIPISSARGGKGRFRYGSKGLIRFNPQLSKSLTFRVAMAKPLMLAIAAI